MKSIKLFKSNYLLSFSVWLYNFHLKYMTLITRWLNVLLSIPVSSNIPFSEGPMMMPRKASLNIHPTLRPHPEQSIVDSFPPRKSWENIVSLSVFPSFFFTYFTTAFSCECIQTHLLISYLQLYFFSRNTQRILRFYNCTSLPSFDTH